MTAKDAFAAVFDEIGIEEAPKPPMTAKEAFSIAFDALPSINDPNAKLPSSKPAKGNIKKNPAAAPSALGKGMGIGGGMSPRGEKSLAEHALECQAKSPETCPYTRKLAKQIAEQKGISMEEAMGEATGMHTAATQQAMQSAGQPPSGAEGMMQPQQQMPAPEAQPLDPKAAEQAVEQLEADPSKIPDAQSELLPQPEMIETVAGSVPVQTTVQKAGVEALNERAANGDEEAIATLGTIKEGLSGESQEGKPSESEEVSAEETSTSQEENPVDPRFEQLADEYVKAQTDEERDAILKKVNDLRETIKNEKKTTPSGTPTSVAGNPQKFTSSDGTYEDYPDDMVLSVLAKDPSKQAIYQKIVDNNAAYDKAKDEEEKVKLSKEWDKLNKEFFGAEYPKYQEYIKNKVDSIISNTPPPPPPPSGGNGSTPPPPDEGGSTPPPEGGESSETPEGAPSEKSAETPPTDEVPEPPPPSDDQFRVDDNTFEVGDVTYNDVSKMGLLHGMLSAFMAGLRGEDIITGWDRISGNWDKIKRSAAGEQLRSGIAGASFLGELDKMAAKALTPEAKTSLEAVRKMFEDATTPQKQMAAIKQYRQWKKDYEKELGESHEPGKKFPPLPNDYKGGKAPLDILKKPEGFQADKEFGNKVAQDLEERFATIGMQVDGIESVEVGPSATTVQFKVSPVFNINKAQSKATKDSLKGAIGTDVTKIEYAKGKKDVISVQITNPKMRNVSFADVMHSKGWQDFSKKAALPVPLGKDASGNDQYIDIAKQPHMIVTGASGSGKSVFLASAIAGLEMAKTPEEARVVVLDPKDEFKSQDGSPHLLYPRAKETKDIASVVSNLRSLMDERIAKIGGTDKAFDPTKNEYQGDSEHNIKEYNAAHPEEKPMEHVMVVFDEVAKVMKDPTYGPQVIADISQIQALGRSVGIDCILATQRNDVKSIPGEIQANAPAHLAFKASNDDAKASQEVKDLAGSGDFIMLDKEGKKTRGRACFISNEEISAVPAYYRDHMEGAPKGEEAAGAEKTAEAAAPEQPAPEPPKEEPKSEEKAEEPKKAKDMRIDFSSRESMLSTAKAIKDKEIAEADERYQKTGDLDKYEEAVSAAEAKENRVREMADRRYPEESLADGDAETTEELPTPAEPEQQPEEEPKEEEWESPLARANKPENRISAARDDYENGVKALDAEKRKKGMSDKDYYTKLEELEANYNKKIEQIKSGKSVKQILEEEEQTAKAEEAKNEALRKSVVTNTKKGPVAGAVHMLQGGRGKIQNIKPMPSMQAAAAKKNLPDGFEIDSDDRGRPLVNGMGLSYARNPKNGSYGWIDRNGGFHMKVNTADSRYKGENSPEAKDLKAKMERSRGGTKAKLEKQYRGVAFGLDEAPKGANMEIVAAAVQEAIADIGAIPTEG